MTLPSIHIDVSAIVSNWRQLSKRSGSARASAVVKADGYGTGATAITPSLARAGCTHFYVAWVEEGLALRKALGPGPEISVFHGISPQQLDLARAAHLTIVLNSLEQIRAWLDDGRSRCPATIHLDTGMNRLGLSSGDWAAAADLTRNTPPIRIMSHLACADDADHALNRQQLAQFLAAATLWPDVPRSLSSTGGIYLGADFALEETRPGIGLYGGGPTPRTGDRPKAVMSVHAPILQVRKVSQGESAGYGATWTSPGDRTLATVGIGYADGFLRAAGNKGAVWIDGTEAPIVGRVSMDMIMIDITDVSAIPGDLVELWGANLFIGQQADTMSTVDYELLTRIGGRATRTYSGLT